MSEIDDDTREWLTRNGYYNLKLLPNGEIAGNQRYLFTWAVVAGIDLLCWRTRWCYGSASEAEKSLAEWNGTGAPSGLWIKQKPEEVPGPGQAFLD